MATFHDTITIHSESQIPSLGTLIGSRVSSEVFNSINNMGHSSFFGSDFDHMGSEFFNRHVRTMDSLGLELTRTVNAVLNPDRFRVLSSIEDFRSIPLCMEMSIVMFEPVRKAIEEGRMEGFGYDPSTLPEEDIFGRLIDNFACNDVAKASDDEGWYPISATLYTDDPVMDDDQLYAIRKTRDYILGHILAETDRDPTCIDLSRG